MMRRWVLKNCCCPETHWCDVSCWLACPEQAHILGLLICWSREAPGCLFAARGGERVAAFFGGQKPHQRYPLSYFLRAPLSLSLYGSFLDKTMRWWWICGCQVPLNNFFVFQQKICFQLFFYWSFFFLELKGLQERPIFANTYRWL